MDTEKNLTYWAIDLAIAADYTLDPSIITSVLAQVTKKIIFDAKQHNHGRDFVDRHALIRLLSSRLHQISANIPMEDFEAANHHIHAQALTECRQLRARLYAQEHGQ